MKNIYLLQAIGANAQGVYDIYKNKELYYVNGEHGPEVTTDFTKASFFDSIEEIEKLKFKDCKTSNGFILRGEFIYDCFGMSEDECSFTVISVELNPIKMIKESKLRTPV